MIEPLPSPSNTILAFKLSGTLHDEDYKVFVPAIDAAAGSGKVRLLTIERIALVGEKTWEKWMAAVCRPFTLAKVRYFDVADLDAAWAWLKED